MGLGIAEDGSRLVEAVLETPHGRRGAVLVSDENAAQECASGVLVGRTEDGEQLAAQAVNSPFNRGTVALPSAHPTEERTPVLFASIYRTPLEGESQPSQKGVRNRVQSEGRDGATLCPGRRHLAGRRATCHLGPDAFVRRHRHRGSLGPVHRCHRRSRGQERMPSHPDRMDEISCHMLVSGTTRPLRSVRSRYAP